MYLHTNTLTTLNDCTENEGRITSRSAVTTVVVVAMAYTYEYITCAYMCSVHVQCRAETKVHRHKNYDRYTPFICEHSCASIMSTYVCACSVCAHALSIFIDNDTQTSYLNNTRSNYCIETSTILYSLLHILAMVHRFNHVKYDGLPIMEAVFKATNSAW